MQIRAAVIHDWASILTIYNHYVEPIIRSIPGLATKLGARLFGDARVVNGARYRLVPMEFEWRDVTG